MYYFINTALLLCIRSVPEAVHRGEQRTPGPWVSHRVHGQYLLSVKREKYSVWWANRLPLSGKTNPPAGLRTLQSIPTPQDQPLC